MPPEECCTRQTASGRRAPVVAWSCFYYCCYYWIEVTVLSRSYTLKLVIGVIIGLRNHDAERIDAKTPSVKLFHKTRTDGDGGEGD